MSENQGCLGAILRLFGGGSEEARPLPYRLRDDFLSPAEMQFHGALSAAVGDRARVCPKVGLGDLFFVVVPSESQAYRNKIDRKHVDFLLCDPVSMRPLLGIELDDRSHQRADRQARDMFVNEVFRVANLPLWHVPVQASYDVAGLAAIVGPFLRPPSPQAVPAPTQPPAVFAGGVPACPKCGVPMVVRTVARGDRQGSQFYGCPNYPRCRETRQVEGGPAAG